MEEYLISAAIAFLVWIFFSFLVRKLSSASGAQSKLNLPPTPTALPIIGHLHLLGSAPHQALHKLSTRLGPIVLLRLGSVPCVVASDAETAKEFLKTHELFFSDRPRSKAVDCLNYGTSGIVFAPYGGYWRFMKKLCVSELLGGRTVERLQWIRREEVRSFFQILQEKVEKGHEVDVGAELLRLTSNVICQMVMSKRCSGTDGGEAMRKLVEEISEVTGKFNTADFIGFCKKLDLQGLQKRVEDVHRRFDRMMEGILKEREDVRMKKETTCARDDAGAKDLLDMLLDISEDEAAEMRLKRENIKSFVTDIFTAGTDTAAITTDWALAELINHPAILQKAREEIDSVVGQSRLVDESDIPNLPFLQAITKETLRLHPAVPLIWRQSTRHCQVMGYDIPANTRLFVNVWAMGRDPKQGWRSSGPLPAPASCTLGAGSGCKERSRGSPSPKQWEDPLEFRPERFMVEGRSAGIDVRGQHFQLLPFGSGRRACPGISLALQVMQPTLGAMIQCFEWRVENGVADMAEGHGLMLPRAHPLVCKPTARLRRLPLLSPLASRS